MSKFCGEVSKDGKKILCNACLEKSRHCHFHTLGESLGQCNDLMLAMEQALTKSWTHITDKHTKEGHGGQAEEHKKCIVELPEKCKSNFRDPPNDWELCDFGAAGSIANCVHEQSCFHCLFLFTVNSKNATPARASNNSLLTVDHSHSDNPVNEQNVLRRNLRNTQCVNKAAEHRGHGHSRRSGRACRSPQKRSHGHDEDLEESVAAMSISLEGNNTSRTPPTNQRRPRVSSGKDGANQ